LTCRELYGRIVQACAESALVTGIELLVLEAPVLKLRAHVGTLAFVEVFFNEETGKTSFALLRDEQRMFGADNTRGWPLHPIDTPETHRPCAPMSFDSFLRQVEREQHTWRQPTTNEGTTQPESRGGPTTPQR
jgi:hypothetical protein